MFWSKLVKGKKASANRVDNLDDLWKVCRVLRQRVGETEHRIELLEKWRRNEAVRQSRERVAVVPQVVGSSDGHSDVRAALERLLKE